MIVSRLIRQELGTGDMLIEFGWQNGQKHTLQDNLGCTSLETVSIQMAIEEAFGLKFATGPADRSAIDDEWDACRNVADIDALVEKWTKDPSEGIP